MPTVLDLLNDYDEAWEALVTARIEHIEAEYAEEAARETMHKAGEASCETRKKLEGIRVNLEDHFVNCPTGEE